MAEISKIQIRRGQKSRITSLALGELAFASDTNELFVGTGTSVVNVTGCQWIFGTELTGTMKEATFSYANCPMVKTGDIYFNIDYGNVYACSTGGLGSAAKWRYKGNVKVANNAPDEDLARSAADGVFKALSAIGIIKGRLEIVDDLDSTSEFILVWSGEDFSKMENGYYFLPPVVRDCNSIADEGSHQVRALSVAFSAGECGIINWTGGTGTLEVTMKL